MNTLAPRVRSVGALMAIAILAAACSTAGSSSTPSPSQEATSPQNSASEAPTQTPKPARATIRVALYWTVMDATFAPAIMATELGYYEDENLDVEWVYLQGSAPSVQAVGGGAADIGFADSGTILAGIAEGAPLVAVAGYLPISPSGVITSSDVEADSLADLEGLTIATAVAGPEPAFLKGQLTAVGLDIESGVELQFVDPQAKCTLLIAGTVDACTGFAHFQLLQVRAEDPGAGYIPFSTEESPVMGASIFSSQSFLAEQPDVITRFLRATKRGYFAADQDLDAATRYFLNQNPEGDGPFFRAGAEVIFDVIREDLADPSRWGLMSDKPWTNLQDLLIAGEVLTERTPVEDAFTNDVLPTD